jgi:superfamily II DNA or RNA helicase
LNASPWITNIWFPDNDKPLVWPSYFSNSGSSPTLSEPEAETTQLSQDVPSGLVQLNPSQQEAVNTMLSDMDEHRITIIQGPPGTGKTSVIAAFVQLAISMGFTGIWLVAASNVAVKNIAEKLAKIGFTNWRLLVSQDFHYEWLVSSCLKC